MAAGYRYTPLGDVKSIRAGLARRGKLVIFMCLSVSALLMYLILPGPFASRSHSATSNKNLHLLIPASNPDINLCKLILSTTILGYPTPVIINWNKKFEDPDKVAGGSHLAKITGIYEYLTNLDSSSEEDVVVIVDGYDVWFQLRPQTLLDRFFDINRRADERIGKELGNVATNKGIRQEIIFGAQKRWWPWAKTNSPYYAAPESSLPKDVYGPETDTDIYGNSDLEGVGHKINYWLKYRQRYLNSGVTMGTVRAMRKLFGQASEMLKTESNFGSDQYIFSHIFGDQELWREVLRRDALAASTLKGDTDRAARDQRTSSWPKEHLEGMRAKAAERADGSYEFSVGLDYGSEIALNTVFAEDDAEWFRIREEHKVATGQKTIQLPRDISRSRGPYSVESAEDLPRSDGWADVQLFTDIWTGISPAIIHHTAHVNGTKARRESWWPNLWFHNHTRALFEAESEWRGGVPPLANSGYNNHRSKWWPSDKIHGGVSRDGLATNGAEAIIPFKDMCEAYEQDIF